MKIKIKKNIFVILLILISLLAHWYVIFDTGLLNSGDWIYLFNTQSNVYSQSVLYYSFVNFGFNTFFPNNWFFYVAYSALSPLLGWDVFTRIFFLIPIVFFTPIFSFYFFKKLYNNNLFAFSASLLYTFNTIFLKLQLDWITYAYIWWILPALILCIDNYFITSKKIFLILTSMLIFLSATYEIRITFLVLLLTVSLTFMYCADNFFNRQNLSHVGMIIFSICAGLVPHTAWAIPILFSGDMKSALEGASPGPFNSFYGILDVLTLHTYSWVNNLVREPFFKQNIEIRFFLIPIVSFIGIFNVRRYIKIKNIVLYRWLSIVLLISILLGKQGNIPFENLYDWLFYNVPLFNIYRESSKFLIFLSLAISVFFGFGIVTIYRYLKNKLVSVMIITSILTVGILWNTQHFIDQEIGYMTKGVNIEYDYSVLSEALSNDSVFGRTLWIPTRPRFGFYSYTHPNLNSTDLLQLQDNILNTSSSNSAWVNYTKIITDNSLRFALDKLSVKYVIIPLVEKNQKLNKDGLYEDTLESFEYYGDYNDYYKLIPSINLPHSKIASFNKLTIFENPTSRPHLYTSDEPEDYKENLPYINVDMLGYTPTQYEFNVSTISANTYLYFTDTYSKSWKLSAKGNNLIASLFDKNYYISDDFHTKTDLSLNSYFLDFDQLCKVASCAKDINGNNVIKLYLTYGPESYVLLGKIVGSIGTLFFILFILRYKSK